jgi:hypothetical protein
MTMESSMMPKMIIHDDDDDDDDDVVVVVVVVVGDDDDDDDDDDLHESIMATCTISSQRTPNFSLSMLLARRPGVLAMMVAGRCGPATGTDRRERLKQSTKCMCARHCRRVQTDGRCCDEGGDEEGEVIEDGDEEDKDGKGRERLSE